jgi:hypothetical protein
MMVSRRALRRTWRWRMKYWHDTKEVQSDK